MKNLRIRLSLLAFLLTICLTACQPADSQPIDTTAVIETTAAPVTEPAPTTLDIVKDGICQYTIIRPEMGNETVIGHAQKIRNQLGTLTGVYPDLGTDWVQRNTEHNHETLEILVGLTDYSESAEALQGIPYGDYIVKAVGNKLVINAWSEDGLSRAVTAFNKALTQNTQNQNCILPPDINLTGTAVGIVNELPVYTGGKIRSIYHSGDNNQVIIIDDTSADEYAAYRKTLEDAGYTLYTENDITGNRFATYTNSGHVVTAGFYGYNKESRIIIEPRSTLPALESENQYQKVVEPKFAMLGLEFMSGDSLSQNGICFIWQLSDGSFIIVDGGFNRSRDAKAIYDYMYKHAPDKNNITIASWIMTHAHGDHAGAWYQFAQNYYNRVTLEQMIGNFPSDEAREDGGLGSEGSGSSKIMKYVSNFKGAKFIKAHVGQEFFLRDAKVEILYTLESYAPNTLSYFNTSSLIFTLEIAGQRFLILGDASNNACTITQKMYGDYLKSDFIHAAHHGYTTGSDSLGHGGVTTVYTKAAAPVVLWPIGEQDYANMYKRAYSAHLQNLKTTKEIIVAGSRDFSVNLPYTYGTSGQETILSLTPAA
ncbi:MAG: MBL fold metallo-hydrolase [Clostridia bacterium]|nr:MBL fold metallo-hydrolase [Clostridia bacterium]